MRTSGLGSILTDEGLLTENDRLTIRRTCGQGPAAFARGVLALGLLDEEELAGILVERGQIDRAPSDLSESMNPDALALIEQPLIIRLEVVPVDFDGKTLVVAMADPTDRSIIKQLEFFTGYKIHAQVAALSEIHEAIRKIFPGFQSKTTALEDFMRSHADTASRALYVSGDTEIGGDDPSGKTSLSEGAESLDMGEMEDSFTIEDDESDLFLDDSAPTSPYADEDDDDLQESELNTADSNEEPSELSEPTDETPESAGAESAAADGVFMFDDDPPADSASEPSTAEEPQAAAAADDDDTIDMVDLTEDNILSGGDEAAEEPQAAAAADDDDDTLDMVDLTDGNILSGGDEAAEEPQAAATADDDDDTLDMVDLTDGNILSGGDEAVEELSTTAADAASQSNSEVELDEHTEGESDDLSMEDHDELLDEGLSVSDDSQGDDLPELSVQDEDPSASLEDLNELSTQSESTPQPETGVEDFDVSTGDDDLQDKLLLDNPESDADTPITADADDDLEATELESESLDDLDSISDDSDGLADSMDLETTADSEDLLQDDLLESDLDDMSSFSAEEESDEAITSDAPAANSPTEEITAQEASSQSDEAPTEASTPRQINKQFNVSKLNLAMVSLAMTMDRNKIANNLVQCLSEGLRPGIFVITDEEGSLLYGFRWNEEQSPSAIPWEPEQDELRQCLSLEGTEEGQVASRDQYPPFLQSMIEHEQVAIWRLDVRGRPSVLIAGVSDVEISSSSVREMIADLIRESAVKLCD